MPVVMHRIGQRLLFYRHRIGQRLLFYRHRISQRLLFYRYRIGQLAEYQSLRGAGFFGFYFV